MTHKFAQFYLHALFQNDDLKKSTARDAVTQEQYIVFWESLIQENDKLVEMLTYALQIAKGCHLIVR